MKWPWSDRERRAEERAREAEAKLRRARAEYTVARMVADASRRAKEQNGFAELIRTAMGVPGDHKP